MIKKQTKSKRLPSLPTILFFVIFVSLIIARFIEHFYEVDLLPDPPDWLRDILDAE